MWHRDAVQTEYREYRLGIALVPTLPLLRGAAQPVVARAITGSDASERRPKPAAALADRVELSGDVTD